METFDLQTTESWNACAMCGGKFPGPGIELSGNYYCCDRCAEYSQHKSHMVLAMAPKLAAVLAIGAGLGYLFARHRGRGI